MQGTLMDLSNGIRTFLMRSVIVVRNVLYYAAKWMLSPAIIAVVLNHYLNEYPSINTTITSAIHQIPPMHMIPTLLFSYRWFLTGPIVLWLCLKFVSDLLWLIAMYCGAGVRERALW